MTFERQHKQHCKCHSQSYNKKPRHFFNTTPQLPGLPPALVHWSCTSPSSSCSQLSCLEPLASSSWQAAANIGHRCKAFDLQVASEDLEVVVLAFKKTLLHSRSLPKLLSSFPGGGGRRSAGLLGSNNANRTFDLATTATRICDLAAQ